MKKIFAIAVLLTAALSVLAVPAHPGKIRYTQPDGSVIEIFLHGDEWGHWITNAAGQVVEQDEDGYFHVVNTDAASAARAAAIHRKARQQSRKYSAQKAGERAAVGQRHYLVVLVQFPDKAFTVDNPQEAFSNLLNQEGYSYNGATGSARDYYYENSHGKFEPVFDVYGPVTLANNMSYYGGNTSSGDDKAPEEAVAEACTALDEQIDFTQFDNDGDGKVDLVFMYYAGYGEADGGSSNTIWPHQWELSSGGISLTLDGKTIDSYACTNELMGSSYGSDKGKLCGIGTACHEFGHAMGLPDFYDPDYETNGQAAGLFFFSTMDSGSYNNNGRTPPYFNIEERILLGWLDEESALQEFPKNGSYTLLPVQNDLAYKIPSDQEGEYFVLECRDNQGWDSYLEGAKGLLVYHVDKSSRSISINNYGSVTAQSLWSKWHETNSINENGDHPCFYIVPSADQDNLLFGFKYYSGYGYYFDYGSGDALRIAFPGNDNITSYRPKSWNKVDSPIALSNIQFANNQSTFAVSGIPSLDYAVIANPGKGVYTAGSSFKLALNEPESRPSQSVSWFFDDEPVSGSSVVLTAGKHVVEAVVTVSGGGTDVVTLEITAE